MKRKQRQLLTRCPCLRFIFSHSLLTYNFHRFAIHQFPNCPKDERKWQKDGHDHDTHPNEKVGNPLIRYSDAALRLLKCISGLPRDGCGRQVREFRLEVDRDRRIRGAVVDTTWTKSHTLFFGNCEAKTLILTYSDNTLFCAQFPHI